MAALCSSLKLSRGLCSFVPREMRQSSLGGIPSMDQHRQEPGCPEECLKLQAGVVSSCTSLGIPEEEDSIKFPLSAYGVHVE